VPPPSIGIEVLQCFEGCPDRAGAHPVELVSSLDLLLTVQGIIKEHLANLLLPEPSSFAGKFLHFALLGHHELSCFGYEHLLQLLLSSLFKAQR